MQVVWTKHVSPILVAMLITGLASPSARGQEDLGVEDEASTTTESYVVEEQDKRSLLASLMGGAAGDDDAQASALPPALSKLTVHGFLTQAYAEASYATGGLSSPTSEETILGIPEDGTFNYRTLAIQFRYDATPKDIFIIQFSSRSLGESPINGVEDDIEVDWAFYERRIHDYTSIKVGRVQIPLGIFNEVRDVGTILPFYRPAFIFYREGSFTSETIDGLVLSHSFNTSSDWSIDLDVYGGEYELLEANGFVPGTPIRIATAEDVFGLQFWVNTPLTGLRFGAGGQRRDVTGGFDGLFRPMGEATEFETFHLSFDLALDRFVARTEYRVDSADPDAAFFGGEFEAFYAQIGYHAHPKFRIYFQAEQLDVSQKAEDFIPPFGIPATRDSDATLRRELGVALNYLISPNVVLKLEHHFDIEADQVAFNPVFTPTGPQLDPFVQTATGGDYSILSLSASF